MTKECKKSLIILALNERKSIAFDYYDHDTMSRSNRIGDPYALYHHKTTNNITLDLYQTGGQSNERYSLPDWRNFLLENILNVRIVENSNFQIHKDYNPNANRYRNAIAKLQR